MSPFVFVKYFTRCQEKMSNILQKYEWAQLLVNWSARIWILFRRGADSNLFFQKGYCRTKATHKCISHL